ncbi:MAG: hypothetical protein NTZ74_12375 [Chloroflexi bacterium]|nr:hypothetical protein [Chloroflexota bacterium]
MSKKRFLILTSLLSVFILTSCTLPEVTPPVIPPTETNSLFIVTPAETASSNSLPIPAPVEITVKNASEIKPLYKAAVSNVQELVWSSDSKNLALSTQNSDGSGAQLFGVTTLLVPDLIPTKIFSSQTGWVSAVASDGRTAALVTQDMKSFSLIDLQEDNAIILSVTPGFLIGNVTFSSDMRYVAVSKVEEWGVVLYSFPAGEEVRTLTGFETAAPVYNAGFKESPQWMVWHARGTIQLQELETGKFVSKLEHEDFVTTYALTADGTVLASASGKTVNGEMVPAILLWDAAQGIGIKTLVLTDPAYAIEFSPNGKLLAIGTAHELQIWDATSGESLFSQEDHSEEINALAFSPDGKFIATSGLDNQLYLWQIAP